MLPDIAAIFNTSSEIDMFKGSLRYGGSLLFQIGNCATAVCTISARICDQFDKLEFVEKIAYIFQPHKKDMKEMR